MRTWPAYLRRDYWKTVFDTRLLHDKGFFDAVDRLYTAKPRESDYQEFIGWEYLEEQNKGYPDLEGRSWRYNHRAVFDSLECDKEYWIKRLGVRKYYEELGEELPEGLDLTEIDEALSKVVFISESSIIYEKKRKAREAASVKKLDRQRNYRRQERTLGDSCRRGGRHEIGELLTKYVFRCSKCGDTIHVKEWG